MRRARSAEDGAPARAPPPAGLRRDLADAVVRFLPEDATSPTETGGGRSSGVVGVARERRDVPVASALPSDPTRLADAGVFAVAAADDSPPDRGVDPTSPDTTLLVDTLGRPPEAPTTSLPGPGDRDAAALLHRSSSAMDASLRGAMSPPRDLRCAGASPQDEIQRRGSDGMVVVQRRSATAQTSNSCAPNACARFSRLFVKQFAGPSGLAGTLSRAVNLAPDASLAVVATMSSSRVCSGARARSWRRGRTGGRRASRDTRGTSRITARDPRPRRSTRRNRRRSRARGASPRAQWARRPARIDARAGRATVASCAPAAPYASASASWSVASRRSSLASPSDLARVPRAWLSTNSPALAAAKPFTDDGKSPSAKVTPRRPRARAAVAAAESDGACR